MAEIRQGTYYSLERVANGWLLTIQVPLANGDDEENVLVFNDKPTENSPGDHISLGQALSAIIGGAYDPYLGVIQKKK